MRRTLKWTLPALLVAVVSLAALPDTARAGHQGGFYSGGSFNSGYGYSGYRGYSRYGDPYHFYSRRSRIHAGPHSRPHNGPHFHWNHGYHWGPHWQNHSDLHGRWGHSFRGL